MCSRDTPLLILSYFVKRKNGCVKSAQNFQNPLDSVPGTHYNVFEAHAREGFG